MNQDAVIRLQSKLQDLHSTLCDRDDAYRGGCRVYDAIAVAYEGGYEDAVVDLGHKEAEEEYAVSTFGPKPMRDDLPSEVAVEDVEPEVDGEPEQEPEQEPEPVYDTHFGCDTCERAVLWTKRDGRRLNECVLHGETSPKRVQTLIGHTLGGEFTPLQGQKQG